MNTRPSRGGLWHGWANFFTSLEPHKNHESLKKTTKDGGCKGGGGDDGETARAVGVSLMSLSAECAALRHAHSTAQVVRITNLSLSISRSISLKVTTKDGGCKGDSDDNETANAVGGVDDESFCGTRPLTISQYSSSNQNHKLSEPERDKRAMA